MSRAPIESSRPQGNVPEPDKTIDVSERGRTADGKPMLLDRRLFMQFTAYDESSSGSRLALQNRLAQDDLQAVLYQDVNLPHSLGLLAFCESPDYLIDHIQTAVAACDLRPKPEFTMLGRTYAIGYETQLEDTLIHKPIRKICDAQSRWAVFYPLRRKGDFERQAREEQRTMLMEHGGIGMAFGKAGLATDIRLACHGLNQQDNDFIVGLLGPQLHPLSAVVQRMRGTRQTAEFIEHMGPFFVGRAMWQPKRDVGASLQ